MLEDCYISSFKDVVPDILLKLPVKSLLKCKSVCKEWKALIEDPNFVDQHLNQETNSTQLLVQYVRGRRNHEICAYTLFKEINFDGTPISTYEDLDLEFNFVSIYGPCNGMFLVRTTLDDDVTSCLTLWNLSTREWTPLPTPESILPSKFFANPYTHAFGLGMDLVGKDFKIVWLCIYTEDVCNDSLEYGDVISIYTLSNNTWRYVDCSSVDSFGNSLCNTYINGVYYWADDFDTPILSFDMSSEAFCLIPWPAGYEHKQREYTPGITLYGDMLAIFVTYQVSEDMEGECSVSCFVMVDDGSWSKLFTVGPFDGFCEGHIFWRSNEILLHNRKAGRLLICNTRTGESKDLGLAAEPFGVPLQTFFYKESLFSAMHANATL